MSLPCHIICDLKLSSMRASNFKIFDLHRTLEPWSIRTWLKSFTVITCLDHRLPLRVKDWTAELPCLASSKRILGSQTSHCPKCAPTHWTSWHWVLDGGTSHLELVCFI
jgi:hypothetical protein